MHFFSETVWNEKVRRFNYRLYVVDVSLDEPVVKKTVPIIQPMRVISLGDEIVVVGKEDVQRVSKATSTPGRLRIIGETTIIKIRRAPKDTAPPKRRLRFSKCINAAGPRCWSPRLFCAMQATQATEGSPSRTFHGWLVPRSVKRKVKTLKTETSTAKIGSPKKRGGGSSQKNASRRLFIRNDRDQKKNKNSRIEDLQAK